MSLISDKRRALSVKDETSWLTAGSESNVHLTLLYLVDIAICRNGEQVAILILSGAVQWDCDLEEFFEVSRLSRNHF